MLMEEEKEQLWEDRVDGWHVFAYGTKPFTLTDTDSEV